MKKEFVTYPIALALKELGFNEISRFGSETSLYNKDGNHTFYSNYGFMYSGLSGGYIYAPLWQQVIDFLREKHNIIISNKYIGTISRYEIYIYDMFGQIEPFENYECSDFYTVREQAILKALELCKEKK